MNEKINSRTHNRNPDTAIQTEALEETVLTRQEEVGKNLCMRAAVCDRMDAKRSFLRVGDRGQSVFFSKR